MIHLHHYHYLFPSEWLVPQGPTLETLAAKHGLIIKKIQNFHDYVREFFEGKNSETLKREIGDKGILDFRGSVSEAEWKIIRLYAVIIFEKSTGSSSLSNGGMMIPQSPDLPPPSSTSSFVPSSPDGPPPPSQTFVFPPSSPDSPPPEPGPLLESSRSQGLGTTIHIPSSPDAPPPQPTTPDAPPPTFPPSSPDAPPPSLLFSTSSLPPPAPLHAPSSPEGPPPDESSQHIPQSPDAPPPDNKSPHDDDDDDEEDDEVVIRMLKLRKIAIRLAGGQVRNTRPINTHP